MARKSEGFGDDVERALTLLRLKKVAALMMGTEDCASCAARQKRWNNPELRINQILHNGKQRDQQKDGETPAED